MNVKTACAVLGILTILGISNTLQLSGMFSFLGYVILCAYCKSEFGCSIIEAIMALVLCMIIITSTQFICFSIVSVFIENKIIRAVVGNILILVLYALFLPKSGVHRVYRGICKRSRFVLLLVSFMCLVIISMLLVGKTIYEVPILYFVLVIPAIVLLLYSIMKWYIAQVETERMEDEVQRVEKSAKEYEDLLTKVRLRQHEFKNHMAAILSAHYTHKTYEKLVLAQEEYCKKIMAENRYNNLLLIGDNILAGYLYRKFQDAEEDEIEIKYSVSAKIDKSQVPLYYVIEMLGILLDNAVEALKHSEEKRIVFEVLELEDEYQFTVMNPFCYVSYDEISEWFMLERSVKGDGRGLGLYHLKCLCEEWHCDIGCRCSEMNNKYWIVFTLKIRKADNK